MSHRSSSWSSRLRSFGLTVALTVIGALGLCATGCVADQELVRLEATMSSDGYALFLVDNPHQQRNDVSVRVEGVEAGTRYALIYSPDTPTSAGWFLLDPTRVERCGGDLGPHCDIGDGFGYLVDVLTVPEDGRTSITLRDQRCGCAAGKDKSWTGYWAVLRVERTDQTAALTVDVWAKRLNDHPAMEPEIKQML